MEMGMEKRSRNVRYIESKNKDQKHKGWFYDHNTKNFYRWDLFITISKFVVSK